MNDRRFIELLNLYVDQELSPDEARELEQEITHHPDRRRIYSQYCRMQRACVRLLEQQPAPAPRMAELTSAATAVAAEPLNVIRLPDDETFRAANRGRRGLLWISWGSGLVATAACTALAFVLLRQPQAGNAPSFSPAVAHSTPAVDNTGTGSANAPAIAAHRPATENAAPASSYRPVVILTDLQRGSSDQFANTPSNFVGQPSLEWLLERRLTPIRRLPLEPYPFDVNAPLTNQGGPMFVNERRDNTVPAESITFEFRR
jgi:hypothetical protein